MIMIININNYSKAKSDIFNDKNGTDNDDNDHNTIEITTHDNKQ